MRAEAPELPSPSSPSRGSGRSWARIALTGLAACIGLAAFAIVAAFAVAVAIVGGLAAAIALAGRRGGSRAAPPLLEGRRTADGWTVEPAR